MIAIIKPTICDNEECQLVVEDFSTGSDHSLPGLFCDLCGKEIQPDEYEERINERE
jgi:hypothetical protein|tara:strand:- start:1480 stop:1647 length:168 start_codon:yes stop_codon:yes gene_type:complete